MRIPAFHVIAVAATLTLPTNDGPIRDIKLNMDADLTLRSLYYLSMERNPDELGQIGRAIVSVDVRSGPYGECDIIANIGARSYVMLRGSAMPGGVRVLLIGGGHGYAKVSAFEISNKIVTSKVAYPGATKRIVDDPFNNDFMRSPLPPAYTPSLPSRGLSATGRIYLGSSSGHWISEVTSNGKFIELEDDSLWEVSPLDTIDSSLWLATEDIVVVESKNPLFPYRLINKDQGETVEAKLIRQ
jgi:hypothetical protein